MDQKGVIWGNGLLNPKKTKFICGNRKLIKWLCVYPNVENIQKGL